MSEQKQWTFNVEDIFEDIPDDPKNVIMKIPDEIAKQVGIDPGDTVKVLWGDKGSIVIQKLEQTEKHGKE
jgi:bifunctional DNA-binding transcriptional regulator/antitoxin component of YhaV-PrlF toxin-antitoxin module|tara:strand:+ start:255 stop:464 length:210 start_codon:yes stop_codon:yes gene_type:complete